MPQFEEIMNVMIVLHVLRAVTPAPGPCDTAHRVTFPVGSGQLPPGAPSASAVSSSAGWLAAMLGAQLGLVHGCRGKGQGLGKELQHVQSRRFWGAGRWVGEILGLAFMLLPS